MYTSALPLIIVLLGVFLLARLTGDPTSLYLPESATEAQREAFALKNGFDRPLLTQLGDYFTGVVHLDFGTSLRTGESASEMAFRAFPATLQLAATTMLLAVVGAIVIGCWAAYRPNSLADRFSSLLSMTGASIPDFWFAITGVWLFAVLLGVLPTSGTDGPLAWILPIATLMIRPLGVLTQVVRGAMVSALSAPYVRLARSKGAGDLRVVTHHALRNAAAPALTVAGDLAVGHFVAHTFNAEAGGAEGDRFYADYKAKTGHAPAATEPQTVFAVAMVADALKRVKAEGNQLNVNALAKAIETARVKTPIGEITMRASDHQAQVPMVVSTVAKDAKFKADDTDMGFKPVKLFSAAEASTPAQASCKMQRPS